MTKQKQNKNLKYFTYSLVVIMLLAMLLSFQKIGDAAGNVIDVAGDEVSDIAMTVLGVAIGLFLISTGVASLVVPWFGLTLITTGLSVSGYHLYPYFKDTIGDG